MGKFGGSDATKALSCSFCGKDESRVRQLLAGSCGGLICDECVTACVRILGGDREATGLSSVLRRLAIRIRAWTRNTGRGSAYVEVLK